MQITGFEKLQARVPALNTPLGALRFFGIPLLLFAAVTAFFMVEDRTSQIWIPDGEVVIGTLGFWLMSRFFRVRDAFKEKYGPLAYSQAAGRFLFPGLLIVFAVVARIGYVPGPAVAHFSWFAALTILGWFLLFTGVLLWLRSILAFGIDNLTMLYVYFPEDGQLVHHSIYDILRHPIYGAAVRIAWGLALVHATWFALTLALIFAIGMWGWVRLVEEKELLARFDGAYADYRRRVPAFWPRIADTGEFFRFLIAGRTG